MGKRSTFERKPRDYYPTPLAAVLPLVPHLPANFVFAEPCAGDGRLIEHIESQTDSVCAWASDIEPQGEDIEEFDVFDVQESHLAGCDLIITNPPWDRKILHPMIEHLSDLRPTFLLFDADWIHTLQSASLVRTRLCKIISVGRVKWIEDSAGTGKDNCAWYLFDRHKQHETEFHGRQNQK